MPNSAIAIDAGMPSTTTNAPRSEPKNSAKHQGHDQRALDQVA